MKILYCDNFAIYSCQFSFILKNIENIHNEQIKKNIVFD